MPKLTLDAFKNNPDAVVEQVFGEGGLLGQHVENFKSSPEQVEYGKLVARATARGLTPSEAGRLTLIDAATGIGKTLPYTVVGLLAAVLTGKRFMVATNTRALMHQLVGQDGQIAARIVEQIAGRKPTLAPRRSRSGFASPERAEVYADSIRGKTPDHAAALEALAAFTKAAIDRVAEGRGSQVVADLDGLPESFAAENPAAWDLICELPADKWGLSSSSSPDEEELWRAYGEAAKDADGVIVTHAAALIDQSLHGTVLDRPDENGDQKGYAMVVIDEAHALERAAALAFQTKRSVSEIARDAIAIRDELAEKWFPKKSGGENTARLTSAAAGKAREETIRLANAVATRAETLAEKLRDDVKTRGASVDRIDVRGFEDWIPAFQKTLHAVKTLARHLGKYRVDEVLAAACEFEARKRDMEFFWDCVKRRRRAARAAAAAKENGEVVSTRQKGLFRPKIVLTPARDDPSFQVVPARGQRIISRLWWRGETKEGAADRSERPIKANAVLFTSATLGYPGRSGWESFKAMTWTLGIDEWDEHLINQDLCATLEPRKFGEAKFIFAHPSAPLPTGDDGEGGLSLESARYAAAAIAHVAYTPNPKRRKKSCRILVLTKNTVDPQKIHDRLPEDLKLRCIVRRKGDGLREGAKRFKEASDAIFIAYGAWEGLDLPGLVDYLVVTRLPFNPPPGDDDETNAEFGGNLLAMLRTLRQGLGRAIRNWNDSTTYVFTDPRIGLPEAVYVNEDVVPHEKSSPRYLRAVPVRFRKSMDAGTLLPEPAPAPRGRARRAAEPLEA